MSSLFRSSLENPKDYFIATYDLASSTNLRDASWDLAIGQSVGNPNVRNQWETDELFENHSCKIIGDESELKTKSSGVVKIAFPIVNTDWKEDGISHLLVQVMGGQLDIDRIVRCRLIDLEFPKQVLDYFQGPKYGVEGVRKFTGVYDKPLLGAIVKPKIGITPKILLEMVKELVEGGVNFIKEDEIMSNPNVCPIEERVPLISGYLKQEKHQSAAKVAASEFYRLLGDPRSALRVPPAGASALRVPLRRQMDGIAGERHCLLWRRPASAPRPRQIQRGDRRPKLRPPPAQGPTVPPTADNDPPPLRPSARNG